MSVVRMPAGGPDEKPVSGGGMDRVIEKKGLPQRVKIAIGAGLLVLGAGAFFAMAPDGSSQTIAAGFAEI